MKHLKLDDYINLSGTIDMASYLIKKAQLISVNLAEEYSGKFNLIRYLMYCFHFVMFTLALLLCVLLLTNDTFYQMVDNEYIPHNFKPFMAGIMTIIFGTASSRFDFLIAEWNGTICFQIFIRTSERL